MQKKIVLALTLEKFSLKNILRINIPHNVNENFATSEVFIRIRRLRIDCKDDLN